MTIPRDPDTFEVTGTLIPFGILTASQVDTGTSHPDPQRRPDPDRLFSFDTSYLENGPLAP